MFGADAGKNGRRKFADSGVNGRTPYPWVYPF